jgi:hypothetical protein
MLGNHYDCPPSITKVQSNFVLRLVREKEERWIAVLPYYASGTETKVVVPERIADVIISNWKNEVPVALEFQGGFSNGTAIEAYHYSLKVVRLS